MTLATVRLLDGVRLIQVSLYIFLARKVDFCPEMHAMAKMANLAKI